MLLDNLTLELAVRAVPSTFLTLMALEHHVSLAPIAPTVFLIQDHVPTVFQDKLLQDRIVPNVLKRHFLQDILHVNLALPLVELVTQLMEHVHHVLQVLNSSHLPAMPAQTDHFQLEVHLLVKSVRIVHNVIHQLAPVHLA